MARGEGPATSFCGMLRTGLTSACAADVRCAAAREDLAPSVSPYVDVVGLITSMVYELGVPSVTLVSAPFRRRLDLRGEGRRPG